MLKIPYWIVPIFSGSVWLGMLLAMLCWWGDDGCPHLSPMSRHQHIAYISDIGAHKAKPLFIAMGTITVVTFDFVLIAERWLRHRGRLPENTSWLQKALSILSILAAIAGAVGLIILTCLDDLHHHRAHDACLIVFLVGYIVSAICICWEYQRLGIHHRQYRVIRASFWIKLLFIIIEISLAIAFGVLRDDNEHNAAAVVEWVIAFIFTFYLWSFAIDFIPADVTKPYTSRETQVEMATATEEGHRQRRPDRMSGSTMRS